MDEYTKNAMLVASRLRQYAINHAPAAATIEAAIEYGMCVPMWWHRRSGDDVIACDVDSAFASAVEHLDSVPLGVGWAAACGIAGRDI
tara:strand:- start:2261 stop:2524 length:264 start_codon:yes stop_codon:yes gene_type:complete